MGKYTEKLAAGKRKKHQTWRPAFSVHIILYVVNTLFLAFLKAMQLFSHGLNKSAGYILYVSNKYRKYSIDIYQHM